MPLQIDATRFALPPSQYIPEAQPKDTIVLHFTAGGTAAGAFQSWLASKERVATAYLIDRDGKVYQCFPPECWAYHLGIGHAPAERRSIGIELVNWGPLRLDADTGRMCSWPKDWRNPVCTALDEDRYVEAAWRGEQFFERFTDGQYESVAALLDDLCQRFSIPRAIRSAVSPGDLLSAPKLGKGILTHSNFRADKWDIGPAFDWSRVA